MFLIRMAFWGALIVLLLPSDKERQAQLYRTASEVVRNAATFCDRNAALCEQGAKHWAVFRAKLDFGTRLVFDMASERLLGVRHAVDRPNEDAAPARQPAPSVSGRVGA
ncbi:MAG: hypothetical protein ACK4TL_16140 [Hyphomicrobiaceae bacterium]